MKAFSRFYFHLGLFIKIICLIGRNAPANWLIDLKIHLIFKKD